MLIVVYLEPVEMTETELVERFVLDEAETLLELVVDFRLRSEDELKTWARISCFRCCFLHRL